MSRIEKTVFICCTVRSDKGEFDAALTDCAEAMRLKPGCAEFHDTRGVGALRNFDEAIRLEPNFADPGATGAIRVATWATGPASKPRLRIFENTSVWAAAFAAAQFRAVYLVNTFSKLSACQRCIPII
jgi:hypothetical protein